MISSDLTIQLLVFRLLAGLIIITVQGLALVAVAVMLGDKGPVHDGRLTPSPLAHLDMWGIGSMMLSGFGWGKPVDIEAAQLRIGRWGLVIAPLVASLVLLLLATLLVALVLPALTRLPYTAGITTAAFLRTTAQLSVWMAIFALVPLPPVAGAYFLAAAGIRLPPSTQTMIGIGLLVISSLGITRMVLLPVYRIVAPMILGPELGG